MGALFASILLPTEAKTEFQFPWDVSYSSKQECGCWESDLGPVEEQPTLSLQSFSIVFLYQSLRNDLDVVQVSLKLFYCLHSRLDITWRL